MNLKVTTAISIDELSQISRLNFANLRENLSTEEKVSEGFVSWPYPTELLEKMNQLSPSIIVKDDNKVIGYALTLPAEAAPFHSDLRAFMEHINNLEYLNRKLSTYRFYFMGQICIDKAYRGKKIVDLLYQGHKNHFINQFDLLVTEVSTSNVRSLKAHEKIGFKTIHTYRDAIDEWDVIVWDWRLENI